MGSRDFTKRANQSWKILKWSLISSKKLIPISQKSMDKNILVLVERSQKVDVGGRRWTKVDTGGRKWLLVDECGWKWLKLVESRWKYPWCYKHLFIEQCFLNIKIFWATEVVRVLQSFSALPITFTWCNAMIAANLPVSKDCCNNVLKPVNTFGQKS